jgi:hypothetical protein
MFGVGDQDHRRGRAVDPLEPAARLVEHGGGADQQVEALAGGQPGVLRTAADVGRGPGALDCLARDLGVVGLGLEQQDTRHPPCRAGLLRVSSRVAQAIHRPVSPR